MNAPATFTLPRPTAKADDLRRRTIYAGRAQKAADEFAWHYQRDPNFAELQFLDAAQWLTEADQSDRIAELLSELGWSADGYRIDEHGDERTDWDRRWKPLGEVA